MSGTLEVRIEWLDAPGVTTPELAATWARYEVWVNSRCATQVEAADGTLRRSVYGSLYPLAEWIAANWWTLIWHIRPSAVETRYWTWPNVRAYPWLAQHNFRGAGDGMAWPNITFVPEGSVTQVSWAADNNYPSRSIRFVSNGSAYIEADLAAEGIAGIVDRVLERLSEQGLPKTRLAEEWNAIAKMDGEERDFCQVVARLGLDPYAIDDRTSDEVVQIASVLPAELIADFFDSADSASLVSASDWTRRAIVAADRASDRARKILAPLYGAVSSDAETIAARDPGAVADVDMPWTIGYAMARKVRSELGIEDVARFDPSPWVAVSELSAQSGGIQGIATVNRRRCGLALGPSWTAAAVSRFGQARALGLVLGHPQQKRFILSSARGHDEKVAGAFAAELLAPARGIKRSLDVIGKSDDAAIEAVASQYRVSPLLVRHQFDNQIAGTVEKPSW
jgi:hypothetical protein